MKKQIRLLLAAAAAGALLTAMQSAEAKIAVEPIKSIKLADTPQDITFSRNGQTAYILGRTAIMLYSVPEGRVTETIPLTTTYGSIALSPDETTLYLAGGDAPEVGVVQFSIIHDIAIGTSPVIGNAQAPVTVTAFFDYQCPYCARVYPLLQELLKKHPDKAKLVIKHFPLSMHKFAEKASLAALAAARQNKYEKVTELFFKHFSALNDATIRTYLQEAGVDMQKFDADVKSPEIKQLLEQDKQTGRQVGVRGVPAIFIDGISPKGRSLDVFSRMVEEQFRKKK